MNANLKEFFLELSINGFFNNVPYLGADSMLSDSDIVYEGLERIHRDKYVYIVMIRGYRDLIIGEKYNVIFTEENPREYVKTDVEVDYLSRKKGDNIIIIPNGYGGIVRLKFKDKVPEITKFLIQDNDEQYDREKHKFIYFTTQEVLDEILKKLDNMENPIS